MAQPEVITAAMRRAEPAIAAGADPYTATGLVFGLSECNGDTYRACQAECPQLLTALIEKYGVDFNRVIEDNGQTLMTCAALSGSTKCIAVLLSHGADVNLPAVCDGNLFSPLLAAAQRGHIAVCRQHVEAGANVEFRGIRLFWRSFHGVRAASIGHGSKLELHSGAAERRPYCHEAWHDFAGSAIWKCRRM